MNERHPRRVLKSAARKLDPAVAPPVRQLDRASGIGRRKLDGLDLQDPGGTEAFQPQPFKGPRRRR